MRRKKLIATALAWTVAFAPPAATPQSPGTTTGTVIQNLPRLGDAASDDLSPATERRIGEAIVRDLRRDASVLEDAELTDYLNRFASVLTATSAARGHAFEFFLFKDSSMNAFALPGGVIGVHTGLLLAAQNESELASVLSHEIGHVTQRHIARMLAEQRQSSVMVLAALVLAALAARSNPQAAVGAVSLGASAQQQSMLGFSRDAEREADRVGIEILTEAGFDAGGMVGFFTRLQRATQVYENGAPAYLRTHPLTTERIADMQARLRETRYRQRPDGLDFVLARAKLRALGDPGVDGLRRARAGFERQLRERSAEDERAAWYGLALVAHAQRDAAGSARALAEARRRIPGGHPFLERLAAESALDRGDGIEALALSRAAAQRYPQARAIIYVQARALIALGEPAQSVAFLKDQLAMVRSDPELWRLLAQAHDARGERGEARRASAEQYALSGGWMAAIEQLRLAQRERELDFYAASQVDARIRELQSEYTREQQERAGR